MVWTLPCRALLDSRAGHARLVVAVDPDAIVDRPLAAAEGVDLFCSRADVAGYADAEAGTDEEGEEEVAHGGTVPPRRGVHSRRWRGAAARGTVDPVPGRATVRCPCGWGPERCRSTTIARGCPRCRRPLEVKAPVRTLRVVLRLVVADMEALGPRSGWGAELRRLTRAEADVRRAEAAPARRRPPTD